MRVEIALDPCEFVRRRPPVRQRIGDAGEHISRAPARPGALLATAPDGRGMINLLAADRLMDSPRTYGAFLLWLLPVGGITPQTMAPHCAAGADGFGLGRALCMPGQSVAQVAAQARSFRIA
ncbi:helicase HerA-like domain-containing protein [Ancylobacter vacuolatus]|nr:helicase HerA-like domain-containing protein [Ancylobacter vacuolatus]